MATTRTDVADVPLQWLQRWGNHTTPH